MRESQLTIIDRWAQEHNLNKTIRNAVIHSLCQRDTIHCSREIPRVFSITVSDLSDKFKGGIYDVPSDANFK